MALAKLVDVVVARLELGSQPTGVEEKVSVCLLHAFCRPLCLVDALVIPGQQRVGQQVIGDRHPRGRGVCPTLGHMASRNMKRDERGYPKAPSRALLSQWVKKACDKVKTGDINNSWKKAGQLLPLDGSEDAGWARKNLTSDMQGNPLDAEGNPVPAASEEPDAELVEILDLCNDGSTGDGEEDKKPTRGGGANTERRPRSVFNLDFIRVSSVLDFV